MFRWILATRPTSLLAATLASFRCRFSHLRCEALTQMICSLKQQGLGSTACFAGCENWPGLEVCVMVLVTAGVLAVPFDEALRDATSSQLPLDLCAHPV